MRSTLLISLLSAALLGGAACKKSPEEKAEKGFEKAREELEETGGAVRKEGAEVEEKMKGAAEETKEVGAEKPEMAKPSAELEAARARYQAAAKDRLQRIDTRIAELEARGDAKSHETAMKLKEHRNELSTKLDKIGETTDASWNQFKADADSQFETIERDLDAYK
jgi:phage shock protein A